MSFINNMITFEGRQKVLKSAELLERNARNIYPHISTSKIKAHLNPNEPKPDFYQKYSDKIRLSRQMIRESQDLYSSVIFSLQELKIGNCTEEAIFAELLGKINGQNNIYSGCIYIDNKNNHKKLIDHSVAFITDKKIQQGAEYSFKNKDAIIIDPWLCITDFAGSYFNKIKSIFRDKFKNIPNNDKFETKTLQEYNSYRKKHGDHFHFCIIPFNDNRLKNSTVQELKVFFPELILKNFKKFELPKRVNKE